MESGLGREVVGAFMAASVSDRKRAAEMLTKYPALRTAQWGSEPLIHYLAIEAYSEAVQFLCENGFEVDAVDVSGDTALMQAAVVNSVEVARVLLEHGADPNVVSEMSNCALHAAVSGGNVMVVDLLLAHGADAGYRTELGQTWRNILPNKMEKQNAIRKLFAEAGDR